MVRVFGVGFTGLGNGTCKVALVEQLGGRCVENVTFGCDGPVVSVERVHGVRVNPWSGSLGIWVAGGCRGRFRCGPMRDMLECGHPTVTGRTTCVCRTSLPPECQQPTPARGCPCSDHGCWRTVRCRPTKLCNASVEGPGLAPTLRRRPSQSVAIITALCFAPSVAREEFKRRGRHWDWYVMQFKMLTILLRSLAAVGTTLPRYTMVTSRYAEPESYLEALGSTVLPVRTVPPPPWANEKHAGTFTKLQMLSLTQVPFWPPHRRRSGRHVRPPRARLHAPPSTRGTWHVRQASVALPHPRNRHVTAM